MFLLAHILLEFRISGQIVFFVGALQNVPLRSPLLGLKHGCDCVRAMFS